MQDTRNKSQKLFDSIYRPKIESHPLDIRQTVKQKGVNGNPNAVVRGLREVKGRKHGPKHLQWLPYHTVKDPAVEDALAEIDIKKLEAIRNFKYF